MIDWFVCDDLLLLVKTRYNSVASVLLDLYRFVWMVSCLGLLRCIVILRFACCVVCCCDLFA